MRQRQAFEYLTRLGFAARGLLYIVIGLLVIGTGRAEDAAGVLEYLSDGVGKWLLIVMAGGFGGYGVWRLCDAVLGIENRGDEHEARKRAAAGISGVVHLYLANKALDTIEGAAEVSSGGAGGSGVGPPACRRDRYCCSAIALGLAGAGIFQLVKATKCSFLQHLDERVRETWVKWLGRIGYAARGLVFLLAASFVGKAAIQNRSSMAGGVEEVLEWLSSPLDLIVAAGLLLFGIYGLIEAWYRRIHTLDAHEAKRRVTEEAERAVDAAKSA